MRRLGLRVGAELESGAVVVGAAGVGARRLLLGLLGLGAQSGLTGSVVGNLAREHDIAKASLYRVKFRTGDNVFLFGGQNARDFLLCVFDAIGSWWMRREHLGDGAWAALLVSLNALEESHIGIGVVAGFVHVLQAEKIGFALGVAAKLEKGQRNREGDALIHGVARHAIGDENHRVDGSQLHEFARGCVLRVVARPDVG